jgi:hypothetical protein
VLVGAVDAFADELAVNDDEGPRSSITVQANDRLESKMGLKQAVRPPQQPASSRPPDVGLAHPEPSMYRPDRSIGA